MNRRIFVLLPLLACLASGLYAQAAAGNLAGEYLAQARQAFREGRREQAAALLQAALEFQPQSSEASYLYARVLLGEQSGSFRAVSHLLQALEADTWVETDPLEAVTQLSGFYARTRRFAEARRLLDSLEPGAAPANLGSRCTPALAAIWARALAGLGQASESEGFLRRALERFPAAADLHLLLARQLVARGRSSEAAEALRRATRVLPESPEAVLALAALERSAAARAELVDRYLAMGGTDAGAALLALRGAPKDPARYFEHFLRLGGDRQILYVDELQELAQRHRQDAAPQGPAWLRIAATLAERAGRYSGARTLDADADGLYEELYEYAGGQLVGWLLDADQDGQPEARVSFSGGVPQSVTLERAQSVELRYSAYPALATVTFRVGDSRRAYSLFPYQFNAPAFAAETGGASGRGAGASAAAPLRLRFRSELPADEARVRRQSYSMTEQGPSGERLYHLLEGAVTRMEQDPDGRGGYRHVVHYDASGPAEGRKDGDGDGRYEIRERYAGGRLAAVFLDADGDGVEEFAQVLGAAPRSSWDYNADGRYDSVEYQTPEGDTVREFSSRLNGVFDLRAVFRAGRIVRFLRDGQALPVSYDERRGVYWIGRRLDDSVSLEGLEGIQRRGGRTLFGLRYMGSLYVGEL